MDQRDQSRLLVVARSGLPSQTSLFTELLALFSHGDVLVVNESGSFPSRLLGKKPTGAPAEILLLVEAGIPGWGGSSGRGPTDRIGRKVWEALVRPGGKLKPGRRVEIAPELGGGDPGLHPRRWSDRRLMTELPAEEALQRFGHMPLPPYIDREDEELDRERYQTVYAREPGSVAAPTAGLHFTDDLLDEIALRGVEIAKVTLHVGVGTFRPVEVEDPADHTMHAEVYQIPARDGRGREPVQGQGGKVWAVGTTVVRTLESGVGADGRIRPGAGETRLFIRPPYRFRVVDDLVTNFHLPRSTLLMLVGAFCWISSGCGRPTRRPSEGYRFYSYGDAMVIL